MRQTSRPPRGDIRPSASVRQCPELRIDGNQGIYVRPHRRQQILVGDLAYDAITGRSPSMLGRARMICLLHTFAEELCRKQATGGLPFRSCPQERQRKAYRDPRDFRDQTPRAKNY